MPSSQKSLGSLAIFVLALLTATVPAHAYLWDYDTLRDERRGLPGIAEILAGKWEKHSQFFYEQRVLKMKALIEREPANLPAYDNLAVAYEKLGDRDSAIAVMDRKERVKPGEDRLLRDGKDVDDEASYAEFYRKFGPAKLPQPFRVGDYVNPKHYGEIVPVGIVILFALPVSIFAIKRMRGRRRRKAQIALGAA